MEKILDMDMDAVFNPGKYHGGYDGVIITTEKQQIKVGIYNGQSCCENWGYLTSHDNFKDFIGATLIDIKLVDCALNVERFNESEFYEAAFMFVNIETDRGTFQITAYNDHNGYYAHEAVVFSEQINHSEYL